MDRNYRKNEAGIEITSPHYSCLRDGNQAAIPDDYASKTSKSRSFKLQNDVSSGKEK